MQQMGVPLCKHSKHWKNVSNNMKNKEILKLIGNFYEHMFFERRNFY